MEQKANIAEHGWSGSDDRKANEMLCKFPMNFLCDDFLLALKTERIPTWGCLTTKSHLVLWMIHPRPKDNDEPRHARVEWKGGSRASSLCEEVNRESFRDDYHMAEDGWEEKRIILLISLSLWSGIGADWGRVLDIWHLATIDLRLRFSSTETFEKFW